MALSVVMPALEMAQETGKLLSWRKQEGERVTKGEPLLEIETDKAVVEIESPGDGILAGVSAREGAVVPVGQTIAWLVEPGEAPPSEIAPSPSGRRTDGGAARPAAGIAAPPEQGAAAAVRISPKARRLAREQGVDIARVSGSGPGGEILADDILARVGSTGGAASSAADLEALSSVGRLMAERTTQSWTTVPHFFVVREVDAGALVAALEKLAPLVQKTRAVTLTYTDLLIALVARVLPKHPRLNASWTGDGIRLHRDINVGIAVAVSAGVVVAAMHRADTANLDDIAVQRRDVAERARMGRLQPSDIAGATFTISNLGMFHVDAFTAIIVPPQAGILAVGAIARRVVPVDGEAGIGIRPMMTLTLSCDHRVVDGARGAAFLNDVVGAIREPEKWLAASGEK
jgi:pyruvate dehydrogenase E2 component (dihydrolipoamide acetyltransferase)